VGLSTFHFVRRFTAEVGMSPQVYARSYFLLHAAARLRYTEDTVDAVAQDFGYAHHAAFTRAFTKQFGQPPSTWRQTTRAKTSGSAADPKVLHAEAAEVRLRPIAAKRVLARRYLGPRSLIGSQWRDFLSRMPKPLLDRPRLGLAYDDPTLTPPERIRYDCAVEVSGGFKPSEALLDQGFELLTTPEGQWACSDADGSAAIPLAYRRIAGAWMRFNPDWTMEGDPHLELFEITPEDEQRRPKLTVCLRMRPQTAYEQPNLTVEPA
jgi:AraC family transcriptional regulator